MRRLGKFSRRRPRRCSPSKSRGITGRFAAALCRPGEAPVLLARAENTWCHTWGDAGARLFATGAAGYQITTMLVEYVNVAEAGQTVAPPVALRSDTIGYYLDLASSPNGDYLRVPLLFPPALDRDPGSSATPSLPPGAVNRLTATALTAGTRGANGKPFGAAYNSLVIGLGLAASPAPASPGADVVCFRGYFSQSSQVPVPAAPAALLLPYQVTFD